MFYTCWHNIHIVYIYIYMCVCVFIHMLVCWIVGLPGISCEHQSALRPPGPQPGPPRKALAAQVLKEGQLHLALCKHPLAVRMRRRCCPIWGCGRRDSGRVSRATPGYVVSFQWNMRSELRQLLVFLGRKAVWGAGDPLLLTHTYIKSWWHVYFMSIQLHPR